MFVLIASRRIQSRLTELNEQANVFVDLVQPGRYQVLYY